MSLQVIPPLTLDQLTALCAAAPADVSDSEFVERLTNYESEMCMHFDEESVTGDTALVRAFYSTFTVALLLVDDPDEARFLTKRFPPTMAKTDPVLAESKNLLRAVWHKDHSFVYKTARTGRWLNFQEPLIMGRFISHFRSTTFALLSRAYTTMPPGLAATYLGLSFAAEGVNPEAQKDGQEPAIRQLLDKGWDTDGTLLLPKAPPELYRTANEASGSSSSEQMARLIGLVGHLGE